jgi:hypothetical protein
VGWGIGPAVVKEVEQGEEEEGVELHCNNAKNTGELFALGGSMIQANRFEKWGNGCKD